MPNGSNSTDPEHLTFCDHIGNYKHLFLSSRAKFVHTIRNVETTHTNCQGCPRHFCIAILYFRPNGQKFEILHTYVLCIFIPVWSSLWCPIRKYTQSFAWQIGRSFCTNLTFASARFDNNCNHITAMIFRFYKPLFSNLYHQYSYNQ